MSTMPKWLVDANLRLEAYFQAGHRVQAIRTAETREQAESLRVHLQPFGHEGIVVTGGDSYADYLVQRYGGGWPEKGDFQRMMKAPFVLLFLD